MAYPMFNEKRLAHRQRLTGLLPGRLKLEGFKSNISCRPVDISEHGLGILIQEVVQEGIKATLECSIKGEVVIIPLTVTWVKRDFGKQDMYRVGLTTIDNEFNLQEVFAMTGCLK